MWACLAKQTMTALLLMVMGACSYADSCNSDTPGGCPADVSGLLQTKVKVSDLESYQSGAEEQALADGVYHNSLMDESLTTFMKQQLHTAATQTPRQYNSIGFGQCAFEDGTFKSGGWSKTNCPDNWDCDYALLQSSVEQCKVDCDSTPLECIAFVYYSGLCWMYKPGFVSGEMVYYTKTTDKAKEYECFVVPNTWSAPTPTGTTTTTTITTTLPTPRQYTSVGFGQCAFEDGTMKHGGWSKTNCPDSRDCSHLLQSSKKQCKVDCDSMPTECTAFGYYYGCCWMYKPTNEMVHYTKTTNKAKEYECFAVTTGIAESTTTTTTTSACAPYTQDTCAQAANALGLQLGGNNHKFADSVYAQKGCYSYASGDYKGYAYYGTGGSHSEYGPDDVVEPKIRVPGYDCKACEPYSKAACLTAAIKQGLYIGGKGYKFADSYSSKGCYTYSSGNYQGYAYYGTGGAYEETQAALESPQMRPLGYNCE